MLRPKALIFFGLNPRAKSTKDAAAKGGLRFEGSPRSQKTHDFITVHSLAKTAEKRDRCLMRKLIKMCGTDLVALDLSDRSLGLAPGPTNLVKY